MALYLTLTCHSGPLHLIDEDTGQEVEIQIKAIKRHQVDIAVTAPDNITILRDKIYKKERNNVR